MKIVKNDIPAEGLIIAGFHFMPGEAKEVENHLAEELITRKGFKKFEKDQGSSRKGSQKEV